MLRASVDNHQRDTCAHLPYMMMAYRSAEHETTECTPNLLMQGREVATLLDIMYETPSSITDIPQHKWAWELKERMQEAHPAVRDYVDWEMRRQKRYHHAGTALVCYGQPFFIVSNRVLLILIIQII